MLFTALTRTHFQLAGGWRQNAVILIAYFGLVTGVSSLLYRAAEPSEYGMVSAVCLSILTVVQGVLMLLLAPSAVRKAVLRDFQTGMLESHRLTPLSGLDLVLGYLTGPAAQAFLLYVAGLVLGGYFAGAYGQSFGFVGVALGGWYFSQFCLLAMTPLVMGLVLLTALTTSGKLDLTLLLVLFGFFGGWLVVPFVPGVALVFNVMSAGWLISLLTRTGPTGGSPAVMGWAVLLQTVLALMLLAAARRKVRAPDRPAFGTNLGLLTAAVNGVALVVGMFYCPSFGWFMGLDADPTWQWFGSTLTFILVALIPLMAAAVERARVDRAATFALPRRSPVEVSFVALPLLLTIMTAGVMYGLLPEDLEAHLHKGGVALSGLLLLAVMLCFWTDFQLMYLARCRGKSALLSLLAAWLVLKILPLAAAAVSALAAEHLQGDYGLAWTLAGLSPVGTILVTIEQGNAWPGVTFQLLIAVIATVAARRLRPAWNQEAQVVGGVHEVHDPPLVRR